MGQPRILKGIEHLEQLFEDYKQWRDENPILKHVHVGRDGESKREELRRPLTNEGFQNYCYKVVGDVHNYFENTDGRYPEYKEICSRIKQEIRQDQIEGGMAGIYNPSITQRLNNLTEKQQVEQTSVVKILNIDPLADGE